MYDKKLKYRILGIFAAAVMTFTAVTPVWAEENTEVAETDASVDTSSDHTATRASGTYLPVHHGAVLCRML